MNINNRELVNPYRRARKVAAQLLGFKTNKAYRKWYKRNKHNKSNLRREVINNEIQ